MKSFLQSNDIVMYSTHNKGKCAIAERFIRTLKNKIHKYITSVSKNVYIDTLDDIVNKYNDTYHNTIKMKPLMSNQTHIFTLVKKLIIKIFNLKLGILLEYQNIKIFLQEVTLHIGLKKILLLKKLKILYRGHMLLMILTRKKFLELFTRKNCKKQIKKSLELKK